MKLCELCNGLARIYCESDQANLCWDCDVQVHSANILVGRHTRLLLCHVCQSPTAWSATGAKVGRTVCVCERCVNDAEEIDLEDIEVVPWKSTPPPPATTSSSTNESLNSYEKFSLKDDDDSGTSAERGGDEARARVDSFFMRMPLKIQRIEERLTGQIDATGSSAMMEFVGTREK